MLGFLRDHPYLFSMCIALLTASIMWLYTRTVEKDTAVVNSTFTKTLFAGAIAAILLTYLIHRQEPVCTEPFSADS
jgi:hypothetical protein